MLSAWRSRGILRGHVPALRGDDPTHAPRARTGAQMQASVPKRELARPKGRSPVSAADLARAASPRLPRRKRLKLLKLPAP
eukprot:scaffold3266_cov53-Phaeocystis_antarctica.AAC.4